MIPGRDKCARSIARIGFILTAVAFTAAPVFAAGDASAGAKIICAELRAMSRIDGKG
jgi:hypothetical protein